MSHVGLQPLTRHILRPPGLACGINLFSKPPSFRSLVQHQSTEHVFFAVPPFSSSRRFQCLTQRLFHSSPPADAVRPSPRQSTQTTKGRVKRASDQILRDISKSEVSAAFGKDVDVKTGNAVLRRLQARRVRGSLIEYGVLVKGVDIPNESLKQALQWLRKLFPVDEQAAAELWANSTAEKLEQDFDRQAQKLGLTRGDAGEQDVYSRPGNRSMLDDMRIHNEKQAKKREQEREKSGEAQRSRDLQLARTTQAEQRAQERAVALAERREKQQNAAMVFHGDPPKMTHRERLLPSTLVALWILVCTIYLSESYVAPEPSKRMWADIPPTIATLTGLGSIMALITCAWHVPKFWKFMNMYLLSVPALPQPLSMVGNIVSHQSFKHLVANMVPLWLYGISVHEDIGRGNFLAIFFAGGTVASVASLSWQVLRDRTLQHTMSGASGGLSALIVAWSYFNATNPEGPLHASSTIGTFLKFCGYAFPLIQVPLHFMPGVAARIDVMAHAAGAVVGLVAAIALKARLDWKRKQHNASRHVVIKPAV